jgi:hypothetical protein
MATSVFQSAILTIEIWQSSGPSLSKPGDCTERIVENLATVSAKFVRFLAISFLSFEEYRNLAPDCQVEKHW